MAELSELAERSGAAVWVAHHFSKETNPRRITFDRANAGMYARAPDVFATFTRHEEEDCFTVETTCRSFPRPEPFVVRWEYPLWRISAELDPERLKQHPKPGARRVLLPQASWRFCRMPGCGLPTGNGRRKTPGCEGKPFRATRNWQRRAGWFRKMFLGCTARLGASREPPQFTPLCLIVIVKKVER